MTTPLFSAQQAKTFDRLAIEEFHVPSLTLMKNAARCVFSVICDEFLSCADTETSAITVFCGSGNNAGDGYIVAGLAAEKNITVSVIYLAEPKTLTGDAKSAWQFARDAGVPMISFNTFQQLKQPLPQGVIVDALFGIGLSRNVEGDYLAAIKTINDANMPVIAVDIPSGLSADTGAVLGASICADATVTFICHKRGLYTGEGPAFVGEVFFDSLINEKQFPNVYSKVLNIIQAEQQITVEMLGPKHKVAKVKRSEKEIKNNSELNEFNPVMKILSERKAIAHKGHFGHTLLIGGDQGMGGAIMMAAEAAARVGSGLTSVVTRNEHVTSLLMRRPEIMVRSFEEENVTAVENFLTPLIEKASVIVIGPGLGQSNWSRHLFDTALRLIHSKKANSNEPPKKLIVDADGINLLAEKKSQANESTECFTAYNHWVLTPHPGEAARLLTALNSDDSLSSKEAQANTNQAKTATTKSIANDRFNAVTQLQKNYGGAIVLKGAGSLIASASFAVESPLQDRTQTNQLHITVNNTGNPGMATGGMGDVLSGVIGGLLAQHLSIKDAAELGVWLHGKAADRAVAGNGERGLLATDLLPHLRRLVNGK